MTHEIKLPCGRVALVDKCDAELVMKYKWAAAYTGSGYYVKANVIVGGKRTTLYLHRLLYPSSIVVHHRNDDGLDNRRQNLSPCTVAENNTCRGPLKGRRFKGVYSRKHCGGYSASIGCGGNRYYLGSYSSEEAAARAYDVAAIMLHGEYARLNFPEEGAQYASLQFDGQDHGEGVVGRRIERVRQAVQARDDRGAPGAVSLCEARGAV